MRTAAPSVPSDKSTPATGPAVPGRARLRPLVVALPAVSRATTWVPVAVGATAGAALVWLLRAGGDAAVPGALAGLRLAGVLLCTGAAFVLDDPAAPTLASSPTNPPRQRGLRLGLLGAAVGLAWAGLLLLATIVADLGLSELPVAAATLEAAAMLALVLAVAAVASHRDAGAGGVAGGAGLMLVMLTAVLSQGLWPEQATLFPFGPGDPTWALAHVRWAVLLITATVVLVLASLDGGRPRVALVPPRRAAGAQLRPSPPNHDHHAKETS